MNIDQARYNMVEQQIRPWEVLDGAVLQALLQVRRECFVPKAYRHLAFADLEIPLGHGEAMMQPKVEARIVQELCLSPADAVYEVGTGSGYLTALLAHLAGHVTSAEIHDDLRESAARRLAAAAYRNTTLLAGDSARGPLGDGTFDAIVLTGSTPVLPDAFLARLRPGGRLFAVVGEAPIMQATLYRREGDGCGVERLFETALQPLVHAQAQARFRF